MRSNLNGLLVVLVLYRLGSIFVGHNFTGAFYFQGDLAGLIED